MINCKQSQYTGRLSTILPDEINLRENIKIHNKTFILFPNCEVVCSVWFNKYLIYVCVLQPAELVHTLGDSHVYLNHIEALKVQLKRKPRPFPTLRIMRDVQNIEEFRIGDFKLENYKPHPKIDMKMAV